MNLSIEYETPIIDSIPMDEDEEEDDEEEVTCIFLKTQKKLMNILFVV